MALIDEIANPFPSGVDYSRLKSIAPKCGFPQTKRAGALALCQHPAEATLNQGSDRRVVSGGNFPRLLQ
jgi:hypothetical protein